MIKESDESIVESKKKWGHNPRIYFMATIIGIFFTLF